MADIGDGYQIPPELNIRPRHARQRPYDMHEVYQPDVGDLNTLRDNIHAGLGTYNPPHLDLDQAVQNITYRQEHPPPRGPARARNLPVKEGMDVLLNLVQGLKRDVRLIKDAQSKAGAEDWIVRNGQQANLYVDDRDIDGDNIPDIIVRKRSDRTPYIVKGYTTEQSGYPQRYQYYTKYPLASDRKGHSYQDFIDETTVGQFTDGGYTRVPDERVLAALNQSKAQGYRVTLPKEKMTSVQAFKYFIMKPLIKGYKDFCKEFEGYQSQLTGQTVRTLETYLRNNLITIQVLRQLYGDQVLQVDGTLWKKLAQKKDVKQGCELMTKTLIKNRNMDDVVYALVKSTVDFIAAQNELIPQNVTNLPPDDLVVDLISFLQQKPYWIQPRLQV
jgi:hypothetical protein